MEMNTLVHIHVADQAKLSAEAKESLLLKELAELPSVIVALSGGADSAYLAWAADHLREGGVVLGDNAFGFGEIHLPGGDEGRAALRKFNEQLSRGGRFRATMLPTAEGLAMGVKIR